MARGPEPQDKATEVTEALEGYERPFMGTGELAEELGYDSNPGVKPHLERALEAGKIEKTTISGYNIWYLPDLAPIEPTSDEAAPAVQARAEYGLGLKHERQTDGGLTSFEETVIEISTAIIFGVAIAAVGFAALQFVGAPWYPRVLDGVFLTQYVVQTGVVISLVSFLALMWVVFRHYLRFVEQRARSEYILFRRWAATAWRRYINFIARNRPGGTNQ